jgi:LDH2 family malate/lactate/ureidoglycolate dehydrogenase
MTDTTRYEADGDRDVSSLDQHRIGMDELRDFCASVLAHVGLADGSATLVADSLVDAEARGIKSHGVQRTRIYAERLRAGLLNKSGQPWLLRESEAMALVDADNCIGHVGAKAGIDAAQERAVATGVGVAGVRNSNHCGALGYFARTVAEAGSIVIAASNAPPTMTYFGGRTSAVGTNPLCIAVPRGDGAPLVVDMATSATARGKIIVAHQQGDLIPDGWAIDKEGRPTTDPAAALEGSVLPFAGPKGSGLAMMIDLLCGALLGGPTGHAIGNMYEDWTRPQEVGHLFIVLDADGWVGKDAFLSAVAAFAEEVHDLPPSAGFDSVLLPGEIEDAALERARADGLVLSDAVFLDMNQLAEDLAAPQRLIGEAV